MKKIIVTVLGRTKKHEAREVECTQIFKANGHWIGIHQSAVDDTPGKWVASELTSGFAVSRINTVANWPTEHEAREAAIRNLKMYPVAKCVAHAIEEAAGDLEFPLNPIPTETYSNKRKNSLDAMLDARFK